MVRVVAVAVNGFKILRLETKVLNSTPEVPNPDSLPSS